MIKVNSGYKLQILYFNKVALKILTLKFENIKNCFFSSHFNIIIAWNMCKIKIHKLRSFDYG